jgi:hypothetical protein
MSFVIVWAVCMPVAASAESTSPTVATDGNAAKEEIPLVGVTALMAAPEKHPGTIRVRGVVSAVYPDAKQLGLLDPLFAGCCASPCEGAQPLPVRWTGIMPKAKNLVLATGEIQRTGKKIEFVARSIEAILPAAGAAR